MSGQVAHATPDRRLRRIGIFNKSADVYISMFEMFRAWQEKAAALEREEITKEEYDQWRYNYPELDT